MLQIWLELLRSSGVEDVLINLHAHSEQVSSFLTEHFRDIRVTIRHEEELLGSAGTLRANRSWLGDASSFWVLYADVLTSANLPEMQRFHERRVTAATLGVCRVPDPTRCGVAGVDGEGRIVHFVEKPANPVGNLAFSGIMVGTQAMIDAIPDKRPADIGFDVLPRLTGQMHAYPISDFLLDIGTIENYERAQHDWPE